MAIDVWNPIGDTISGDSAQCGQCVGSSRTVWFLGFRNIAAGVSMAIPNVYIDRQNDRAMAAIFIPWVPSGELT